MRLLNKIFSEENRIDIDGRFRQSVIKFPGGRRFKPVHFIIIFIHIIHKFALVRERKFDWENLLGGIGTKERLPIKIKKQLMSNDDFIRYILVPELATKFYMEKDDITHIEASLKLYDDEFPTPHYNDLMDQVFILDCV